MAALTIPASLLVGAQAFIKQTTLAERNIEREQRKTFRLFFFWHL